MHEQPMHHVQDVARLVHQCCSKALMPQSALQVGQWGNCSRSCGGGIRERSVQCMSQFGQPATDNSSCLGVQPANQLQCNVMPCDFCSLTNCASQVQLFPHPCKLESCSFQSQAIRDGIHDPANCEGSCVQMGCETRIK